MNEQDPELIKGLRSIYPRFNVAYEIAEEAHKGIFRKDGKTPYMRHIDAVIINTFHIFAENTFINSTTDYPFEWFLIVAALHDAYEDNRETFSLEIIESRLAPEFSEVYFNPIIGAIGAISKKPKGTEEYDKYVSRLLRSRMASVVKLADLAHNMSDLSHGSMRDKYSLTKYVLEKHLKIGEFKE